jgi:hypothetical protein
MTHNGVKTILKLLTSFLPLHMMNLVITVIALKLISMCIFHVSIVTILMTILIIVCSVAHSTEIEPDPSTINVPKTINKKLPDYSKLRPFFGWLNDDIIKNTFEHTTQYARLPTGTTLRCAFRSPNPALNVLCRNEAVACDIVHSDVLAIDDGSTAAVLFVGTDTHVNELYSIKTDKQFINTMEDNITNRGAPHKLLSNSSQVLISNKVQDILCSLCIKSWQSKPHQQQNPAERRYQTIKRAANRVLDRSGAPDHT